MPRRRAVPKLPSREELLELVDLEGGRVSDSDLARQLGLRGPARSELFKRLRDLRRDLSPDGDRDSPRMVMAEVVELDADGELIAESRALPGTSIRVTDTAGHGAPLAIGDRALLRLEMGEDGAPVGRVFKRLPRGPSHLVGVVEKSPVGLLLRPTGRKNKGEYRVEPGTERLRVGDIVRAELRRERPLSQGRARVVEIIGRVDDPTAISLTIASELGLPMEFSKAASAQAEHAEPVALGSREDLRDIGLVTIDGEDARDFDDAVWAEAIDTPDNPGGFRAVVAIADVAHYVRSGDALDRDAYERGNSVYFPDRVLPMLPEALSNGLCSLKPEEDRACLAVAMEFDAQGLLRSHRFLRGLMRSRARLTYEQVQAAHDGLPDGQTAPLMAETIQPLYRLYEALAAARRQRGTIELDLPERRVIFGSDGGIERIGVRRRLASHQLIEELMIAANVAAARSLTERQRPCLFRVHDKPDKAKLEALADYVERLGIGWSKTTKNAGEFSRLIGRIDEPGLREQVAGFVLRAQSQAIYSPDNIGHFGLNLRLYAHFTSPIRRYSDLIVHRLLIHHLGLADEGDGHDYALERLVAIGQNVSATERTAVDGERRAMARYITLFMADKEGARFAGRVISVQRFGLFVSLDETGAEGLVPVSTLGDDAFMHDERHHALIGERYGEVYALGDRLEVTLTEADTVRGMLVFRIEAHEPGRAAQQAKQAWRRGGRRSMRKVGRRRRH